MMTARDDTSTRPRKFNIMALLLAGSALGIAGCAQQRTEGYYDPPAESTVTDAQSQGSGAGYRTVLRAPSQVQIALKPDASRKTASQQAQAAQAGHTTEDGQPVPEGADSGAASGVAASGAAPAPAVPASTPSAAAHSLVPQPQTYMGTLLLARHAVHGAARDADAGAQRPLARPRRLPGKRRQAGRAGGRTRLLERHRRTPVARDPAGRQGQRTRRFAAAANNVLRVRSIAGQTPNLNYNLTRQPDLDPIDELAKAAAPQCP